MKVLNEPTRKGFELGYRLSVWADKEAAKGPLPGDRERCDTCAFRCGTYASGSPTTTMDALKCVIEAVPFLCHDDHKLCAGYALLRRASPEVKEAPWPFSSEVVP